MSVRAQTIFGKETIICSVPESHNTSWEQSQRGALVVEWICSQLMEIVMFRNQINTLPFQKNSKNFVGLENLEIAQIYFDR